MNHAVEMRQVTKRFGDVVANNQVDFFLAPGEIHALLGENGAGKTTLMRILYGLYQADEGIIHINGRAASIRSPKEAIMQGIGMVTQHFALAQPLTVTENIILGAATGVQLRLAEAHERVAAAAAEYGILIDPQARVADLSIGQQQRVEILKALYRRAKILILDEPTAVLIPQEVEQLFASLNGLRAKGYSVVFISHKLHEVMTITDRVTVLRLGQNAGTAVTNDVSVNQLAEMMVGRPTFGVTRSGSSQHGEPVLRLQNIAMRDNSGVAVLKDLSLAIHSGEIVGLAGVSGNGQAPLADLLAGTADCQAGSVFINGQNVTNAPPAQMMNAGLGRIPEDCRANVVGEMTVAQNMAIEHLDEFVRNGSLDQKLILKHAQELIEAYQIKANPLDKIRTLSGGNLQKVVLARVLERNPSVLIVSQPTRGLDVGATEYVRGKILEQRERGAAVLLISEDLDEVLALADRIAVIYEGEIMGELSAEEADVGHIGLLMSGVKEAV